VEIPTGFSVGMGWKSEIKSAQQPRVWGVSMEDFGVLWIWAFCGDSHMFFCGYGMEIWNPMPTHDRAGNLFVVPDVGGATVAQRVLISYWVMLTAW